MSYLIKPVNYKPLLDMKQTELGAKPIIGTAFTKSDRSAFCIERNGYQ